MATNRNEKAGEKVEALTFADKARVIVHLWAIAFLLTVLFRALLG